MPALLNRAEGIEVMPKSAVDELTEDKPCPPLISIIVPVYNAEKTIGKFLDSLRKSNYPGLDVVFVDDCSTDSSVELIAGFGYTVLRNGTRVGQSISRNRGIEAAAGKFVCFFDSDVILKNNTISSLYASLIENDCDAVSGNYEEEPADRNFFSAYYACLKSVGHGDSIVRDHAILGTYCSIIRKSFLLMVGGFRNFPPGIDIECEDIGRRLTQIGCRFIFNPAIRVAHHFGGFKKQFYVFTKRTYWFARYRMHFRDSGDKLAMRGGKFAASVLLTGLSGLLILLYALGLFDIYDSSRKEIAFLIAGIVSFGGGIFALKEFFLHCLRYRGIIFTIKSIAISMLFFLLADSAVFAGFFVHYYKSLLSSEDILMKEKNT